MRRLCLTGDTAVQNLRVKYRSYLVGRDLEISISPIKLWPRWFPVETQFHEQIGWVKRDELLAKALPTSCKPTGLPWACSWEEEQWACMG